MQNLGIRSLGSIGGILGTLPLAIAAARWGWRPSMLLAAGVTLIIAIATWLLLRNDPVDLGMLAISEVEPEAVRADDTQDASRPSFLAGFRTWYSVPTLWAISLILFASPGSMWAFQALWAGPRLRHVRGLSVTDTGTVLLLFVLGIGLGPILFGFISDRIVQARKPVVVSSILGQTELWGLLIITFNRLPLTLLYVALVILSILGGGVLVAQVMIKELCPPNLLGMVPGIINGSGFYGTAIIQAIIGFILSATGPVKMAAEPIYSAQAYAVALSPILGFMLMASILSFRLSETLHSRRNLWPQQIS